MKLAIMQPTYLPWAGYFNLIASVDTFVFLDDVQFARRSWQQRNRIMMAGREHMLTVPVDSKGRRDQLISEVVTDESQSWRKKHLGSLRSAYGSQPDGKVMLEIIGNCLETNTNLLVDVNIGIIKSLSEAMGLNTPILKASELRCAGSKSQHLLNICHELGADTYLSAAGSREYIEEEGCFARSEVVVEYQHFQPEVYPQKGSAEFVPYLSVVDVIANIGFEGAREYVSRVAIEAPEECTI